MALPLATYSPTSVNPEGLTWEEWRDTTVGFNRQLFSNISLTSDWRDFADEVSLFFTKTPRHDGFPTWQEWVHAFRASLSF
jgi:hypothetical protein